MLTALDIAVGVALLLLATRAGAESPSLSRLIAFAAMFAIVGLFPMRLDLGRHQVTFTLTEAVLVAALFALPPLGVALAAALGECVACAILRIPPLKLGFNGANRLAAASVAAVGFFTFAANPASVQDLDTWLLALVAACTFSLVDIVSVSAIVAAADPRRYEYILVRSVPIAILTTLAAAPLGLVAVDLFHRAVLAPVLLAPLVAAVASNSRYAAHQRDEHLRIERLFEATSRSARLVSFEQAVASTATESRHLLTGVAAVCCVPSAHGDWLGVVDDDDGLRPMSSFEVDALKALVEVRGPCELPSSGMPRELSLIAPGAVDVVLACPPAGSAMPLALAVLRGQGSGEQRRGRVETLSAFATHASLTIGNARLYEEVEDALRAQVDLNRQKDEFVAAVSHELRTPLTAMSGAIATVVRLDGRLNPDDRNRLLEMATGQGGRLKRLIDDLLVVAATEHGGLRFQPREIEVGRVLEAVTYEVGPIAAGRFRVDDSRGPTTIRSDVDRLHQVVMNLIENAIKYAPDGDIVLTTDTDADNALFSVSDHGPGIPPSERERVFDRFVQLDQSSTRRRGGTGLGLYLCRQLAEVMGGTLTLRETPGGGCTFVLAVPCGRAEVVSPTGVAVH